jgi:hypothetical protein
MSARTIEFATLSIQGTLLRNRISLSARDLAGLQSEHITDILSEGIKKVIDKGLLELVVEDVLLFSGECEKGDITTLNSTQRVLADYLLRASEKVGGHPEIKLRLGHGGAFDICWVKTTTRKDRAELDGGYIDAA